MEYAIGYLVCSIALMIALAVRTPDCEIRHALVIGLGWPMSLVLMIIVFTFDRTGYDFDMGIDGQGHWFKVRRPLDGWKGLGVTFFRVEVRVWKKRG